MSENDMNDTAPHKIETQPIKPKRKIGRWILLGLLVVIVVTVLASVAAYYSAIQARTAMEYNSRVAKAAEHYQYGLQMLDEKNYDLALAQFSYVIELDPNFPGIMDKLAEVQLQSALLKTPTVAPTPQPTATPDTRGVEELFNQAQELMRSGDWSTAFQTLESLRTADINFRMVDVDGMYYIILRNLGLEQIYGNLEKGIRGGYLEEGIYRLYLASKFAPLDTDAIAGREWARRYLRAAAYWGVNWEDVVTLFNQIYLAYPYMIDINGVTAFSRYAQALAYYGDEFYAREKYCEAVQQYEASNAVFQQYGRTPPTEIGDLMPKISDAYALCMGPTEEPTAKPTKETAPTEETPTDEPTVEPTPTETPTP